MKVLGEPPVFLRDEAVAASRALVDSSFVLDNLSPNAAGSDHQVKCSLQFDPFALWGPAEPCKAGVTASGTLRGCDLNPATGPEPSVLPQSWSAKVLLNNLAGADEDPLPLVIEVGAVVHELELGMSEVDVSKAFG